jgi:hypothetical protein
MNQISPAPTQPQSSFQKGTLFRRVSLFLVIIFLILALLLTAIPAFNQLRQIQQDARASAAESMTRAQTLIQRVNDIIRGLITDQMVTAYLYSRTPNTDTADNLNTIIKRYALENKDLVRTIGVYNAYFQEYRTSDGVLPTSELSSPIYGEQFSIRPREYKGEQTALEALNSPYIRLWTFVSLADQATTPANNGFIQINVNETLLRSCLIQPGYLGQTLIINMNGLVLSSTSPDDFITDVRYQDYGDELLAATGTAGILQQNIWGNGYLIAYQKQVKSGLIYASIIRTQTLYTDRWPGLIWQSLAILALLAMAMILALLFLRQATRPLAALRKRVVSGDAPDTDEFQQLKRALYQGEQAGRIARQKYLLDVFAEQIDKVNSEALAPFSNDLAAPAYLVIKARFDRYDELVRSHPADLASFRF